jgi:hypothetical protein
MRIKAVDVEEASIPGFANGRFTYNGNVYQVGCINELQHTK